MIYYVNASAPRTGCGSKEFPFVTIQEAAEVAHPGDEVIVAPGLYREYVNPKCGGTEDARITYRSEVPLGAVISGAERVTTWEPYAPDVWRAVIPNAVFGAYNPYTTVIAGDWYYSEIPLHTGEVYLNGQSFYETDSLEGVLHPVVYDGSWFPEKSLYKWYTEQEGDATVIYANFRGADPNAECAEINVRRNCFYPAEEGKGYITLSGFTVKQAATTWAPPTAYQEGMVGPHWSKGWIIEDCEISDSKCCGISLGKYLQPENENKWLYKRLKHGTQTERDAICQAQYEGWTKERIGSHIVRRCHIHDCEQTGIVGHLGGVFSLIEDNHIHHINTKQQLAGAEIGGIKMHAAIDCTFRRNHIHHCTRGIWLDWQAQGTRVTQNLFHHNILPEGTKLYSGGGLAEDLFIEVSHGPTLVDNNIFLSPYSVKLATQGVALVHNLIAGAFTSVGKGTDNGNAGGHVRYTPYHVPHRTEVAGFMTFLHGDDRFYNNIFVQQPVAQYAQDLLAGFGVQQNAFAGTFPFDGYPTTEEYVARFFIPGDVGGKENRQKYYDHLPVEAGGNIYANGAKPYDKEKNYAVCADAVTLELAEEDGHPVLVTNLCDVLPALPTAVITTELLGEAFEPEQKFENPDGTPITFDEDYFGHKRGLSPLPGPFADAAVVKKALF